MESTAFEKKFIPGVGAHEGRGKSMADLINKKVEKFMYEYKPEKKDKYSSGVKVRKNDDPAPTSYDWTNAKDKTSLMRKSIESSIPKTENQTFIRKYYLQALAISYIFCPQ